MTDTNESPPAAAKPGYRTSEFWLTVATKLLGLFYASGLVGAGTWTERIAGLAAMVLASLGYSVSRGLAKAAAAVLLVGAIGATQPACATLKAAPGAAKATVVECAKQDAVPIIQLAAQLGAQALIAAVDQGAIDWPALEAASALQGKVVGGCALTHFVAALSQAPRSDTQVRSLLAPPDPIAGGRAAIARLSARFDGAVWR